MENKQGLLSVIIPVYNAEKYLREAVDSILLQEGLPFEIILVNDGSKDNSGAICDELEKENACIRVIHQENAGSLRARVNGANNAKGDYIMYVDADDLLYKGAFLHISEDLSDDADMYIYDYDMEEVGGKKINVIKIMDNDAPAIFSGDQKKQVAKTFMKGWMNTVCATVFKKHLITDNPFLRLDVKLTNGEDRLQKMFCIINSNKIKYVPYSFYHYRYIEGSQGENLRKGKFSKYIYEQFCATWKIERENYSALGFNDKEIKEYDLKKLNRISATFQSACDNNQLTKEQICELVNLLSKDEFFNELILACNMDSARKLLKKSVMLISKNKAKALIRYWKMVKFVRKIKYGK